MATVRTPREAWIQAALRALAEGGPGAVRVEALATRLGVTKGGFYWHFADRAALLEEMLDVWERTTVDEVIRRAEDSPAAPEVVLRRFFDVVAPATDLSAELPIREWARREASVAERVRRVDRRRMAWFRELFGRLVADPDEADGRAMLTYSLLVGSYLIVPGDADRSDADFHRLALERLLT